VKRARNIIFYEKSNPELYKNLNNDYGEFIKNSDIINNNFKFVKSSFEDFNKNNNEKNFKKSDISINRFLNDFIFKLFYASKISIIKYNYINYLIKILSDIY
jgi:hypothetical protein